MKRQMILFLGIVALFLASSCEKPISDHKGDGVSGEDTYTITIDFKPPVVLQTKSGLSYDKVDRLDVFYFDSEGAPIDHKTFVGNDVLSNRLSFTMKEGISIFFTFFANLPEELAGYLSHMSRGQMLSYAVFPLEEMDRLDYFVDGNYQSTTDNQYGQCYAPTTTSFVIKTYSGKVINWQVKGFIKKG